MSTKHKNLQSALGEVETKYFTFAETDPFVFRSGETLSPVTLAYETYGTLNEDRSNAILLFHALSGSQHAAGINRSVPAAGNLWTEEQHLGWWEDFIGPGKAFDTSRFFVICANYIGGCYGSSGPTSLNPATGKPYARDFPTVMLGDIVDSQVPLLDHLGIRTLHAVSGGSLGGMCAINFAVRYPDRVRNVIPIASGIEVTLLQRILNYEQICAIEEDRNFNRGYYYDGPRPDQGLALARMISHKTFVSLQTIKERAKDEIVQPDTDNDKWYWLSDKVESYLRNQGLKFVNRFDANTYLRIMDAWMKFDLRQDCGLDNEDESAYIEMFKRCKGQRYMVFSIDSDVCYYPSEQSYLCRQLKKAGVHYQYITVHSEKGHDAFLLQPHLFAPHLSYTLQESWSV